MNNDGGNAEAGGGLTPWDPRRYVRRVSLREVRLSHGFLRSRPERWVPGLAVQWTPLSHAISSEIRVVEVRPVVQIPPLVDPAAMISIGADYAVVISDKESQAVILDGVAVDAFPEGKKVLLEYLARRFLGSIGLAWSGQDSSKIKIFSEIDPSQYEYGGAIKVVVLINGRQCVVWLLLAPQMVEQLDGIWRRQVHSTTRVNATAGVVAIEVAQLAVPPSALVDYTRPGIAVDLDVTMTDTVTLRLDGREWLAARICDVEGRLGCEILPSTPTAPGLPEGATRLSIVFGSLRLDMNNLAELCQPGAILETDLLLTDKVGLIVNGDGVGSGYLRCYEGRFALEVQ